MIKNLVNPNKNWGWFNSEMQPLATGDNWHNLPCPDPKYIYVESTDYYEGTTTQELQEEKCPIKSVSAKKDICTRCSNIFIYP